MKKKELPVLIKVSNLLIKKQRDNSLLSAGWSEWQSKRMVELFNLFAADQAAVISPDGEKLLGYPMTTLQQMVINNKSAFA